MAKAKTLAALAGLAGLAYAYNKNKNKDESKTDTGDETDRLKGRGTPEEGPRRKIEDYQKKAPEAEDANYGNEGRRTSMGVAPAPKSVTPPKVKPKLETYTTRKDPREAEAGMSRGTRTPAKSLSTASSSEEGMKNYKPRRTTPNAGAGRGFVNPPMPTPKDPREAESGMSRGTRTTTPPFRGGQMGYDEAGNFMGGQRGFDEAGNPMKKGGMVKKMASGGMSASRRADGIATKGKTRGKIC